VNANGQTAVLEGGDTRATMKAIVRYRYGSPDLPELRNIEKPEIADDEVLVRVRAAGVDRGVWHVMTGLPYPIRLAGFGFRAPKNPVIGSDVAGVVEAIGKDVGGFRPGEEVFGIGKGSYAEYAPRSRPSSRPSPLTSPSSRRRRSPSLARPPCRPYATTGRCARGKRC
jgi:hypothetical protein